MAPNPPNATHAQTRPPRFNETAMAIVISLVVSAILSTLMVGNPFSVMRLAYLDYSHTPANGNVPAASDTRAPLPDNPKK